MASTKKRDQLRALMKGLDIAMFTTIGEDGFPVSRPLSTQDAEFDGRVLWFFVRRDTPKVREIERYPRVNVSYSSKDRNVYLSVAGTAAVVDDQAKIDLLWNDALKAYFKKGPTDPNLTLIEVTVHTVQYWDGPSTGIGKMIAFLAARLGADESILGENRLLRLEEAPARQRRASRRRAVIAGKQRATTRGTVRTAAKTAAATKPSATKTAATKKPVSRKARTKSAATNEAAAKKGAAGKTATKRPAATKKGARKAARR